jgi:hypothetical protein
MSAQIQLWIHLAHGWVPIIAIPKTDFALYTTRPLKWLRYLGSVIHGREGILRLATDGQEVEDYTIMDVNSLLSDYFYYSHGRCQIRLSDTSYTVHPQIVLKLRILI